MMFLRSCALLALLASGSDAARKKVNETDLAVDALAGVGSSAQGLWSSYVAGAKAKADAANRGLQNGCEPTMYAHRGSYKGAIMLVHGFTACSQQFEKLVPLLTAKGYAVFTPVNPGHGYNAVEQRDGEFNDYVADLPTEESEYEEFCRQMNAIMQAANGQKVVFGMSLGGGVAATMGYLGHYDRRFLAAPMMLAGGILNNLISLANRYPWRRYQITSWGPGCEAERAGGRAGICHFNAAIGAAARNLGQKHSTKARMNGPNFAEGEMQIVFVEGDAAVSSNAIINLASSYGMDRTSPYLCGMDAALQHSFLSPYDNPNENKYWLDEVTQMVADYLTDGKALPQGGGNLMNRPRCNVRSTP